MSSQSTSRLETILAGCLDERKTKSRLRRLTTFPTTAIDFSSNSYLSLSTVPKLRQAFLHYLQEYSASSPDIPLLGSGGSRLLDGNSQLAESLEREIASYHNAPAGLLFNSGFDANVGLLSCVPQPGDVVLYDELIHASAHDGMRMSRAKLRLPFRHNSTVSLSETLESVTTGRDGKSVRDGLTTVFIIVEAVYSMDGHVAPLKEIVEVMHRHLPRGNGRLVVDEAHSTGIFGLDGRGLVCELGLEDAVFARLHTFGKAIGGSGAIVLCAPVVREYLVNYARPLIYTTSMPPACLAAIKVAYDALPGPEVENLRQRLRSLTSHTQQLFLELCTRHPGFLRVDTNVPKSPIIPLFTPLPRQLAQYCQLRGFVVRPIVAPTVPRGSERVRICIHAANTTQQIEALVSTVEAWVMAITEESLELDQGVIQKPHL